MKDTNQRLFLAIAIWLACIFGYYSFFAPKKAAQPPAGAQSAATPEPGGAKEPARAAASPATGAPSKAAEVPRGTSPAYPVRTLTFQTPRTRVVATSAGAAIQSLQLLGGKWTRHKGAKEESQVDLVGERAGEPLPFSTALKSADGTVLIPPDASYEVVRQDGQSATFRTEQGGVTLTKTLSLNPATYALDLTVEISSRTALNGQLSVPVAGSLCARSSTHSPS
jgi:YidC/Oxa1 family membrane protein insertase